MKGDKPVLFVASECAPLVKTGGLADVVGALPLALAGQGWDVRVLLPAYPGLAGKLDRAKKVGDFEALFGGSATVISGMVAGLNMLLLDAPHLYERPGSIYLGKDGKDWPDNPQRFAALSFAAAEIARGELTDGWLPGLLHLHDWQAGLAAAYLADDPQRPAIITTIHNIAFQGLAPAFMLGELNLSGSMYSTAGLEYYGQISALKAALVYANLITTVSPTYAQEIMTPEFGMGLQGVISDRKVLLHGILNGIDTEQWNPETDPALPMNYSAKDTQGKATCKASLEVEFGLKPSQNDMLFGVVSRLTEQKGLDLLPLAIVEALKKGGRLVVLGSGDAALEKALKKLAVDYPDQVAVRIGYDENLSHRINGGCDAVLVPSRFEPCGLTQLYGLRYGALPIVSRTGGLADSVIDANPAALAKGVANGFQFQPTSVSGLESALLRAVSLFPDQVTWRKLMKNAMTHPVGWKPSADRYISLYRQVLA